MTATFYYIVIALFLLIGYGGVLMVEARRGARYAATYRARLDRVVERGLFIARHVDFGSFAREEAKRVALYLTHESAHLALRGVRIVERVLTHVVRRLRLHPEAPRPGEESSRQFVRALSDFKGHLETTRPKMPEVR